MPRGRTNIDEDLVVLVRVEDGPVRAVVRAFKVPAAREPRWSVEDVDVVAGDERQTLAGMRKIRGLLERRNAPGHQHQR